MKMVLDWSVEVKNTMINILSIDLCPGWVKYPNYYKELISNGCDEFLPWYLTDDLDTQWRLEGVKKRYPKRDIFPFARKDCSDDVACWEKGEGDKVFIIHDFASPGWEQREIFDNFDEWYKWALQQSEE